MGRRGLPGILLAAALLPAFPAVSSAAGADAARLPRPRPDLAAGMAAPAAAGAPLALLWNEARLPRPRPEFSDGAWASWRVAETLSVIGEGDASENPWPRPVVEAPEDARAALATFAREPRPRPRPEPPAATLALIAPDEPPERPAAPLGPPIPAESEAEYAACLSRLRSLDVVFAEAGPIDPAGDCHVEHALSVTSVGSGVSIAPETILNCRTAEALALWTRDILLPAAEKHLGAVPDSIAQASAYVCRPRYNQEGAKLSEHATANAIDISAIGFADREPVSIGVSEGTGEVPFETAIREGSCQYFTTVLGPGSNAAHATHFHFDLAQRGGGYRLCDLGDAKTAGRAP